MSIDWVHFTPWQALAGGALIGLAAGVLLTMAGKVAGISGIVGGLLRLRKNDSAWRVAFVLGLIASPWVYSAFAALPSPQIDASLGAVLLAGVLVGVGTRYGAGCTSGHGVCGLSRLSVRSLAATAAFMASGFATVAVLRHLISH